MARHCWRRSCPAMMHGYEALIDPGFRGHLLIDVRRRSSPIHAQVAVLRRCHADGHRDEQFDAMAMTEDNVLRGNRRRQCAAWWRRACDTAVFSGRGWPTTPLQFSGRWIRGGCDGSAPGRDGTDRLTSIEVLQFADSVIDIAGSSADERSATLPNCASTTSRSST